MNARPRMYEYCFFKYRRHFRKGSMSWISEIAPASPSRKDSHTVKWITSEKRFYSVFYYEFNSLGGEQKFTRTMGPFPHSYTVSRVLLHLQLVLVWAWVGFLAFYYQTNCVYGRRRALTKDTRLETRDFKCHFERIKET